MRLWTQGLLILAWLVFGGGTARAASRYEPYTFTHLAGPVGGPGYSDGTVSTARFSSLHGIAVDSTGNIYVADTSNSTIRKITPDGLVTTLAGLAGNVGHTDGTGNAARFDHPFGITVDSADHIYVADQYNNTIRKISPDGVVNTLAGPAGLFPGNSDGTGSAARFDNPAGVAVDASGHVYVADISNHTIRKITPAGVVTTLAGSDGNFDGPDNAARINSPLGIAVDSAGHVYVAEYWNQTISKITLDGVVTVLAGMARTEGSADGTGSAARFAYPCGVTVDASGQVYVADTDNHTIRRITAGGVVTTLAGFARSNGHFDGAGRAARFNGPSGVAADSSGNVYVADSSNHAIRKITPTGVVTTLAGSARSFGSADGTGHVARFRYPKSVAVDASDQVYVSDTGNSTIRKITPDGVVTTLAGLAGSWGTEGGTGSAARFYSPHGVAVDASGNIYVADQQSHTIRKGWKAPHMSLFFPDGGGELFIRIQGAANRIYQLQRSQTLDGPWTTHYVQAAPVSGLIEFRDASPPADGAFYRAIQE